MSKQLKRKTLTIALIGCVCVAILGIFLIGVQTNLAISNQTENTLKNMNQIEQLVNDAHLSAEQNQLTYDEVYQSKAATVAYMANKDQSFKYENSYLENLAKDMNITNILILDKQGNILNQAIQSKANFTTNRFNQVRSVFETNEPSDAFEVTMDETIRRYYGARIDENRQVVIENNPLELIQIQDAIDSWESMLDGVKVGLNGYAFTISSKDYTFMYHPNSELVGQDSIHAGIELDHIEDGYMGWLTINGEKLYSGVKYLEEDNAYVIFAVPQSEMIASRNLTVGIVMFIFVTVLLIIIAYAYFLFKEENNEKGTEYITLFHKISYKKIIARKLLTVSVIGLLVIFAGSFYMQTLFSLSQRSLSNANLVSEVNDDLTRNANEIELLTEQYNRRYLNKGLIAAEILSNNPSLQTKEELAELSKVLGVEFLLVFDANGVETVSNSSYVNFKISEDPQDQSYEFNKLLQGVEYVIQAPLADEVSGQFRQYIGCLMHDGEGNTKGFLQLSIYPEKLEEALAATRLPNVLSGIKASGGGFAFAVNKVDQTFAWHPQDRLIGKSVFTYGMQEKELRDGYSDYITLNNERYYSASIETDEDYIYVAVPEAKVNGTRMSVALTSAFASLLILGLFNLLLPFIYASKKKTEPETETNSPMVEVVLPDGRTAKSESAASRWSASRIIWDKKTPEQKIAALLKAMLTIFALFIALAVVFKNSFFTKDSIILYIINGQWEKGLNLFSLTGSIMIICVISVVTTILMELMRVLSKVLDARGDTICRLIRSFAKYISVIVMMYYCFALIGVDTQTLLASAGILSLVIGLGAKSLVSDILAGLFIIFEGEFRVGDIVTIGGWRGTVQEIGVRTTKIMDGGQNVKIISNSDVTGVINMTKKNSFVSCDVGIEYGESLERVEAILAKELPAIRERLSAIKEGPFYKGVVSLGDNSVNVRITAQCAESSCAQLGRDLNREMKLLFDKYDINIPFPQVVINEAKEYQQATAFEKRKADEFNETQKELSKDVGEKMNQ